MEHEVQDLFILTPRSGNRKTGPIPVSMSNKGTCPSSCRLQTGCYAVLGRLGLVWRKLGKGLLVNGTDYNSFCKQVRSLRSTMWRHNQAGDLAGKGNQLDRERCLQLARANCADGLNRGGYSFTHYSPLPIYRKVSVEVARHNLEVIQEMNTLGFVVNLSADNLTHADALAELSIGPVATVLPMDASRRVKTPQGRSVVTCPAVLDKRVNCVDCRACAKENRKALIGFPAHGTAAKRVDKVARGKRLRS